MSTVTVTWEPSAERFVAEGTHAARAVVINAPHLDRSTPASGFAPMELLLAGAGACSAWDVVEILRKQRQRLTALEVRVEGLRDEALPRPYRTIDLRFVATGRGLDPALVERAVRLSEEKYCGVTATVRGVARVTFSSEVREEAEAAG